MSTDKSKCCFTEVDHKKREVFVFSDVGLFSPAGCPMSEWSVWSQCSCESQRQQRYRVALSPATRGQQCTPVETQSRTCSLSQCDGELTTRPVCDSLIVLMLKAHLNVLFLPLTLIHRQTDKAPFFG